MPISTLDHAPEAVTVGAKLATTATYSGATVSVVSGVAKVFGLTEAEWAVIGVIGGLIVGVVGLAVNWCYQHKHYKLAERRAGFSDSMAQGSAE